MIAFAGSRQLSAQHGATVARVVGAVKGPIIVGCCKGVDEVVLASVPVHLVRVFCAFGPGGSGSCSASAVRSFCRLPLPVARCFGGPVAQVPFRFVRALRRALVRWSRHQPAWLPFSLVQLLVAQSWLVLARSRVGFLSLRFRSVAGCLALARVSGLQQNLAHLWGSGGCLYNRSKSSK